MPTMLLAGKKAAVFGAGGNIGRAVALAFAREGATVFLSGRRLENVEAVAADIRRTGGVAEAAEVDALDERAIVSYMEQLESRAGGVDVVLNAMGFQPVQGVPLADLSVSDFTYPIVTWTSSQLLTARSAARGMARRGGGVILTLSASPARLAIAGTGGFGVACAAVEALTRTLAAELSPRGVRVVCMRPHRIGDTLGEGAADLPMPPAEFRAFLEGLTLQKRLPSLADVAETAVFLASDRSTAMTAAVVNLTGGMSVD